MVILNWLLPRYVPLTQIALTMLSSVYGTMDSSGMLSSTSRLTLMVALPMYSTQRLSTNRMSIGMSIVARTRAKQGRSHRRSTVRLRMLPSVVVLRQLSKVIGGTGADVGGMVPCVSWQPQALQVQVLLTCA